jgi:hypothetical protein
MRTIRTLYPRVNNFRYPKWPAQRAGSGQRGGRAPARPPRGLRQDTFSALSSSKKLVLAPLSVSVPVYLIVIFWPM